MNKTEIGWTDRTWNPITGCTKGCYYCYARRLANGRLRKHYLANRIVSPACNPKDPFAPRFWPNRLDQPGAKRTPLKIFVGSMGEVFDPCVPPSWIKAVLAVASIHQQHTFQLLTQQPYRAARFDYSPNTWVGVTITDDCPSSQARLINLHRVQSLVHFTSYEPLLSPINKVPDWLDWIIIGAMTGPGAIKPKPAWVQELINLADEAGIPVFLKHNLNWPVVRQEFPSRLTRQ